MAREEQQKLLASGLVQGEAKKAMPSTNDAAGVAVPPSPCDYCGGMPAVVYCRADSARLCLPCDRHVHGANTVSSGHARAPLCAVCRAAVAAFRRAARFLCSNCDFEKHRDGAAQGEPVHDRGTVEGYTGCPSLCELAAILGVDECEKSANEEGWWSVWEEPQVPSFDDVIVPTTSCHGLQPLLTPSSPKVGSNSILIANLSQLLFTVRKNHRSVSDGLCGLQESELTRRGAE